MGKFIHKILYRTLPLEGYLRAVSRLFFLWQRLGIGREAPATEYVYHLPKLVRAGDTCIDIGANLGYYARTISRLAGPAGKVYAVEPVAPIRKVLSRNLRRCANTEILPYALGTESKPIVMANDSARETGYFGTGQNFVNDAGGRADVEFTAQMRRGSELFGKLERLDFIKCDIEGYEVIVMREMRPLLDIRALRRSLDDIGLLKAAGFAYQEGLTVPKDICPQPGDRDQAAVLSGMAASDQAYALFFGNAEDAARENRLLRKLSPKTHLLSLIHISEPTRP